MGSTAKRCKRRGNDPGQTAVARAPCRLSEVFRRHCLLGQPEMVILLLPVLLRGPFRDQMVGTHGKREPRTCTGAHPGTVHAGLPRIFGWLSRWLVQRSAAPPSSRAG